MYLEQLKQKDPGSERQAIPAANMKAVVIVFLVVVSTKVIFKYILSSVTQFSIKLNLLHIF